MTKLLLPIACGTLAGIAVQVLFDLTALTIVVSGFVSAFGVLHANKK